MPIGLPMWTQSLAQFHWHLNTIQLKLPLNIPHFTLSNQIKYDLRCQSDRNQWHHFKFSLLTLPVLSFSCMWPRVTLAVRTMIISGTKYWRPNHGWSPARLQRLERKGWDTSCHLLLSLRITLLQRYVMLVEISKMQVAIFSFVLIIFNSIGKTWRGGRVVKALDC